MGDLRRRLILAFLGLAVGGCPGTLENPSCFPPPDTPLCRIPEFNVEEYLTDSCGASGCHSDSMSTAANNNLDLVSGDLFQRLSVQPASWEACSDLNIVDVDEWQNSFMLLKLRNAQGAACGQSMPDFGLSVIPQPELDCISRWVVLGGVLDLDESTGCYQPPAQNQTGDAGPDSM